MRPITCKLAGAFSVVVIVAILTPVPAFAGGQILASAQILSKTVPNCTSPSANTSTTLFTVPSNFFLLAACGSGHVQISTAHGAFVIGGGESAAGGCVVLDTPGTLQAGDVITCRVDCSRVCFSWTSSVTCYNPLLPFACSIEWSSGP